MAVETKNGALYEVAGRIRALRSEAGYSIPRMAELTELDEETYRLYEAGRRICPLPLFINAPRSSGWRSWSSWRAAAPA